MSLAQSKRKREEKKKEKTPYPHTHTVTDHASKMRPDSGVNLLMSKFTSPFKSAEAESSLPPRELTGVNLSG